MNKPDLSFLDNLPVISCMHVEPGKCGSFYSVFIEPPVAPAMARLMLGQGYFLEDISVTDVTEGYLAAYHFDHWDTPGRISFRTVAPYDNPVIESIASIYQGAEWFEREGMEMLGVVFKDNPNPAPLLLPPEADFHPLRHPSPAELAPLLKMMPSCKLEDFPPDHVLVRAVKESAEAEAKKPAAKKAVRKDEE